MSSIINITSFRKKKEEVQQEQEQRIISDNIMDDINNATNAVLAAWDENMAQGTLSEYISDCFDSHTPDGNLEDLNVLAFYGRDIGMEGVTIYGPGAAFINKHGYMVSFQMKDLMRFVPDLEDGVDNVFITPEMATENHARAIGILLYKEYAHIAALHRDK